MKSFFSHRPGLYGLSILVPLLLFVLACGAAEEPTPTKAPAATVAAPIPTTVATPTPTPAKQPKRGGTIVQYGSGYPAQFNQLRHGSPTGSIALTKAFLTLMYDEGPTNDKQLVCDLCEKWYLENGGKTIVFQLRGDATFHDGKPITSRDMKYSLETVTGKVDGILNIRVGWIMVYIDTIETPDDLTMKVNLIRPAPVIPAMFTVEFAAIIPEGTKSADLNGPPLGPNNKYTSGPFYLKEAVKDSHLIYERNPTYFKKDKNGIQLPYLDGIKIQSFADAGAATTAFLTGKIDVLIPYATPPQQFLPSLQKKLDAGDVGLVSQGFGVTRSFLLQYRNPLFSDMRVRQAINLAFDREDWANDRFGNELYRAATLLSFGNDWSRPEDKIWNVLPGWGTGAKKLEEIQQAKELLKQAGFATGLNLPILTNATASWGAETLQRQMVNAGINATLDVAVGTEQATRQGAGDFVAHAWSFTLAGLDPDEAIGNGFLTGAQYNWGGVSDPWVDKQFVVMSSEQDPIKRRQLFFEIEDYLLKEVLYLSSPDGFEHYWYIGNLRGIEPGRTWLKASSERGEAWWLDK